MQVDHECAHVLCNCHVEAKGGFCTDECRRADLDDASSKLTTCECRHVDCGTSTPDTPGNPDQSTRDAGSR